MISAESHTKQIRLLNDYISALEKEMSSVKRELEEHHRIEGESSKQMDDMQKEIMKYRQLKRFSNIERDYFAVTEQCDKLKRVHNELNAELLLIRKDLVTAADKNKKMEGYMMIKRAECEQTAIRFKEELQQSQKMQEKKDNRIDQLVLMLKQEKNTSLSKLTSLQNTHLLSIKAKDEEISKLGQELYLLKAKSMEEISEKNVSIGQLQQNLREVNLILGNKVQQLSGQQLRLTALEKQYLELDKKASEEKLLLMSSISKLREDKLTLEALNKASRGSINQNTKALEQSLKRNSLLSQQNSELTANFHQVKQEKEAGLRQIEEMGNKLRESYENARQIAIEKQENQAKIAEIQSKLLNKQEQINKLTQKCKQIEQLLIVKNQELVAKEQQFLDLNDHIEQANMHVQLLQSQLQQSHTSISHLQKTIQQTANQLTQIAKENQNLQQRQEDYEMIQAEFSRSKIEYKNTLDNQVNSREMKINQLNNKIIQLEKLFDQQRHQNIQKIRLFEAEKNAHGLAIAEYAQQVSIYTKKLEQLQISYNKCKQSQQTVNQQYSSYKKRKEAESEQLNTRIKQLQKKMQRKNAKIEELNQQINNLENNVLNEKKNVNSTVIDKQERMKIKYAKQLLEMEASHAEVLQEKDAEIMKVKRSAREVSQTAEVVIKGLRDELASKQKSTSQIIRKLEREVADLDEEVKKVKLAALIDGQQRALQTEEFGNLKKALEYANVTLKDLKQLMDNTRSQLDNKNKEIEALENSNAMLRKQIINSIKNEQTSRKELASSKSKGNLLLNNNSQKSLQKNHLERTESRSSILMKPKPAIRSTANILVTDDNRHRKDYTQTCKSMVARAKDIQRATGLKQSLVEELTEFSGADERNPTYQEL